MADPQTFLPNDLLDRVLSDLRQVDLGKLTDAQMYDLERACIQTCEAIDNEAFDRDTARAEAVTGGAL